MKIKDVIGIYPNAFKEAECKSLMYKLEEAVKNGESYQGMSGDGGVNTYKKSTDYNILEHDKHKLLCDIVMNRFYHYLSNEYLAINNYHLKCAKALLDSAILCTSSFFFTAAPFFSYAS